MMNIIFRKISILLKKGRRKVCQKMNWYWSEGLKKLIDPSFPHESRLYRL